MRTETLTRLHQTAEAMRMPVIQSTGLATEIGWYLEPVDALVVPDPEDAPSEAVYVRYVMHKAMHWLAMPQRSGDLPTDGDERTWFIEELVADAAGVMVASHRGLATEGLLEDSAKFARQVMRDLDALTGEIGIDPSDLPETQRRVGRWLDQHIGPLAEARRDLALRWIKEQEDRNTPPTPKMQAIPVGPEEWDALNQRKRPEHEHIH